MKRLLFTVSCWFSVTIAFAQLPVSTVPQNRKAVLEELTGIYCYWCPAGHKIAQNIKASRPPGSVVLINCHCTGYSTPIFDDPNYKTPEGDTIANLPGMGVASVPAGAINRHLWPGKTTIPVTRNLWGGYVDQVLAKPSYVNLALEGTLNTATRQLSVNVQAYYTGNSPAATNKLTVLLLEDTVIGKQGGAFDHYPEQTNGDGSYRHHHMLRKMLTNPPTGELITTTTWGSIVNRTYTFTIPDQFKNTPTFMGNLKIAAFIAESDTEIITGAYGPVTLTGLAHQRDAAVSSVVTAQEVCAGKLNPKVSLYNNGSMAITGATLSYKVNTGTPLNYTYSGYIAPATAKSVELPQISFTPAALNTLSVTVTGINGNTDQNSANNTGSQDSITITSHIAADTNMRMEYTQVDAYNQSYWKLYDETTETLVAQDGPFPDVPYMVTEVRIKNFRLQHNTCYKLVFENSKFISDYNFTIGNYKLYAGSALLLDVLPADTGKTSAWFKTGPHTLGLAPATKGITALHVSPNPASDVARLSFNLQQSAEVSITVYNSVGTQLTVLPFKKYPAGAGSVTIPVQGYPPGVYTMSVATPKEVAHTRFSITR